MKDWRSSSALHLMETKRSSFSAAALLDGRKSRRSTTDSVSDLKKDFKR